MLDDRKSRRTWPLAIILLSAVPMLVAATPPGPPSTGQWLSTPASVRAVRGAKSNRGGNGRGRWSSNPTKPPKPKPTTTTSTTLRSTTSSTTSTTTTTTSTTTSTTLTSTCLDGSGPLIPLTGTWSMSYTNGSLLDGTRLDARQATFLPSPTNTYPLNLAGGSGICVAGGALLGQFDRTLSWDDMHTLNNAAIRFENPDTHVEYVRIDNVTDGIRPVAGPFTVRGAWLTYVRDDCVENDHVQPGVIDDSLFDGCYVAISERPSPAIAASGYDGRGQLLTVQNSLIRLRPMPGPRGGLPTDLGNGEFFKWSDLATNLELDNNVFMAEQVSQDGADMMGVPSSLVACSNNVMVWLGDGPYPAPLPPCFTVTKDRSVWDTAAASWLTRHGLTP